VHGGAGALDQVKTDRQKVRYLESIHSILEHGRTILSNGGSALQAVETCANLLEDDPLFNAGCGSVLNEDGKIEMDAGIMDGRDLQAGAVAGISNIANPISLARLVLSNSDHVLLIGDGAMRFADKQNVPRESDDFFLIEERIRQFQKIKVSGRMALDHDDEIAHGNDGEKYGTIGAIARDVHGDLAAATSTGGIVNKHVGRVGDSPLIGSGVYADNETCAISTTGFGEDFMRIAFSKTVSDIIEFKDLSTKQSVDFAIEYFQNKVQGRGGFIFLDKAGKFEARFTTKKMIHGWIELGGKAECSF